MHDFFLELARRTRSWQNASPEDATREWFDRERLPGFLDYNERMEIYKDAREIAFPCARPTQYHWHVPELTSDVSVVELQDFLRSTYRFGVPLPDGFHHDAQFEEGDQFDETRFDCSRDGLVEVSGEHANVYPNDFVRADVKIGVPK